MIRALPLLLILLSVLFLGGCAGKTVTTEPEQRPSAASHSLSQMSEDFLYLSAQDALRHGKVELAIEFMKALLKKRPDQQEVQIQLAELLLQTSQPAEAIPHIDAVVKDKSPASVKTPEASVPYVLKARALAMTGKPDEAIDILSSLLASQPALLGARLAHASLLAATNRIDEAYQSIAAGLAIKETYKLRNLQADLLIRQNRLKEATKTLEVMHRLDPDSETPVLILYQIALQQKQSGRAEEILRDHIKTHPDAIRSRNALGRLLVQSGRTREAIDIYRGLVRDTGGTNESLSALGLLYFQVGEYEQAASQFRQALKNKPNDQSRFYLAASLDALGEKKQAEQLYLKIDEKSGVYADAQVRLAAIELADERFAEAEQRMKRTIASHPESADAYMLLSGIYLNQEKYRQLLDETEPALSLPRIPTRLLFNRAIAYEHFKEYQGVESALNRLLEIEPDNAEALNFLGYVYAEQAIKLDKAESLIRRALTIKPDDGFYLDSLAWVFYRKGKLDEAIRTQTRAIGLINDDPVMLEHLGDMLWKRGRHEEAKSKWREAIHLNHKNPALIEKKISEGLGE